jgi:hypothetical protein
VVLQKTTATDMLRAQILNLGSMNVHVISDTLGMGKLV